MLILVACLLNACAWLQPATAADNWFNSSSSNNKKILLDNVELVLRKENEAIGDTESAVLVRKRLASYVQSVLPPFAITSEATTNAKCLKETRAFLSGLDSLQMWALTMYDSTAKIPSGLLNGNVNQFGDFDRCLDVENHEQAIKGKYCLAFIQVNLPGDAAMARVLYPIHDLVHSHRVFNSHLNDSGHRVPRYSTINWGLCLPSSCEFEDVQKQLDISLNRFTNSSGFDVQVLVDQGMCQTKSPATFSWPFIFVVLFLSSFVLLALVASLAEPTTEEERKSSLRSLLLSFSLKRNFLQLFSFKREANDVATVHGIRMLNSIMLLLSHKSMAMFFSPYSNRTLMTENLSQPWTVLARAAALYTDPFIMISGMLTGMSLLRSLKKTGTIDVKKEYISRLTRIVPPMAAIILICTFLLPELGGGPQWNLTVNHHAEKCKQYWWRNFLFIHNYFGFDDMCLTHTHHIGIDTQLFFLSPLLVWAVHKWRMQAVAALVAIGAISTGLRYYTTFIMRLSYFIYPGISNLQMIQTADFSYTIPMHRISMYIMGILLGFAMDYCGKDYKLKPNIRRLGWMVALSLFYYSYIKPSAMGSRKYVYSAYDAAQYAALAPLGWSLMFAWVIFISNLGYGGVVSEVFSQRFGPIWTRLSYSIYLTQFPIYFYNVGMQKSSIEYSFIFMVNFWEFISIFLASTALTLFIEYPFNNIRRWLLKS